MSGPEIFMIGMFCGAYGMFTLIGMMWCCSRDPAPPGTVMVNTKGEEQWAH